MPHRTPAARQALVAWTAFIVVLGLLPLGAIGHGDPAVWVSIVPLESVGRAVARGLTFGTVVSVAGNVAAFVPIGLLAPIAWSRWRSWPATVALGLGVSLGIEAAQLTISIAVGVPYRHADVDDLLLNGLGTAIGYGTWRALRDRSARWRTRVTGKDPAAKVADPVIRCSRITRLPARRRVGQCAPE